MPIEAAVDNHELEAVDSMGGWLQERVSTDSLAVKPGRVKCKRQPCCNLLNTN
jgi:hypothetical protein